MGGKVGVAGLATVVVNNSEDGQWRWALVVSGRVDFSGEFW